MSTRRSSVESPMPNGDRVASRRIMFLSWLCLCLCLCALLFMRGATINAVDEQMIEKSAKTWRIDDAVIVVVKD